eukprot:maker-scaffold269_size230758-snap-gene-0.23 protein:Tk07989 transcript:maker-scaffold269_size230758-snap-gene-0.23-mRNA-1 annotation:"kinesin-like protein kif21a-like"
MASGLDEASSVRVAVRIRPQLPREIIETCQVCIAQTPGEPQVCLGSNQAFTYDHVYDLDSVQADVYEDTVHDLIEGCFDGYNATVLAYGQTGSGKTYTMGTGFEITSCAPQHVGIIPRAVKQLFEGIDKRRNEAKAEGTTMPEFKISTQFLELYNEEVLDLFDNAGCGKSKKSGIRIHEDSNGNIYMAGITSRTVLTEEETISCLKNGAFNRTTASTNMNDQSSRSHAIFTIYIQQQRQAKSQSFSNVEDGEDEVPDLPKASGDLETLTAKFHFVDLAGSERLKRTGATGERAKEGISINCGLLALGNVISALGDTSKKALHVPYRDSKLTRLLQDSLGGNSRTLMIACVSPSDSDFMETLNTLKYANRARNIKNKVTANQDKTSRTILMLRQDIQNLQLELMEYRQGKRLMAEDGTETTNDMYHENTMLSRENQNLRTRIKAMQETIDVLTSKNSQLLAEKEVGKWIQDGSNTDLTSVIQGYLQEIEELRSKLCESEKLCEVLRKDNARAKKMSTSYGYSPIKGGMDSSFQIPEGEEMSFSVQELIKVAKKDIASKQNQMKRKHSRAHPSDEDKDANSADDEEEEEDFDGIAEDEDPGESRESESDDEESDGSETESDNNKCKNEEISEELVELTSEISLKQKLIEELETSQKRLQAMKYQYESKLQALQNKICTTEEERDKVLKNMGNAKNVVAPEKLSKIKQEYQDKLVKLQSEVKKLQTAKKEHAKLLRNQTQYEKQVDKLKFEVLEMKRNKVRLVQKMKEESTRHREQELRRTKELSQMRKQTRKNESRIKNLEVEKRLKDSILKRKNEEVSALRRNQRRISTGGRRRGGGDKLLDKIVKSKWQTVEKTINKIALNKQAISQMENDMDRWLKEREKLSKKLERLVIKRKRLIAQKGDSSLVEDMEDQIESLKANVNYLHENIVDCQQQIVEMEQAENPEEQDEESIAKLINLDTMGPDESRYLLAKLLSMTIHQCCQSTQRDGQVKELENKISQITHQSTLHQQLLQHMIEQQDLEIYDLMLAEQGEDESESESDDSAPAPAVLAPPTNLNLDLAEDSVGSDSSMGRREKARRKMTTKEDLLFNDIDMPISLDSASRIGGTNASATGRTGFARSLSFTKPNSDLLFRSRSFVKPGTGPPGYDPYNHNGRYQPLPDVMTQSMMDPSSLSRLAPVYQPSPVIGRRNTNHSLEPFQRSTSPRNSMRSLRKFNSAARLNEESPPSSPPSYRRQGSRDETGKNVFHRLVAGTKLAEASTLNKGVINPYQGRMTPKSPLICANVAEGHTKAVLSVFATNDQLFSASKDRTVKVWDIRRKTEIQSLEGHPNNVNVVKYSEVTRLAFSASSAFIKIWDLRMNSNVCIKTLSSSGLTTNGSIQMNSANRTLQMPPGETLINDIAIAPSGYGLFSAAGDKVRIWDLRKFHSIGKLAGGHQAAIMCLTTGISLAHDVDDGDYVITGSKDHYVKVFNVPEGKGGVITPTHNLDPPHYDGIECLALHEDTLFSASRDTCIKKWNLQSRDLVRSINNAHKDWICGLSFLPGAQVVVSGCRAGYLKLWSVDTCALIGETKAHNSTINTICTNDGLIFTGSNDGSIGLWRSRTTFDKSPDSDTS